MDYRRNVIYFRRITLKRTCLKSQKGRPVSETEVGGPEILLKAFYYDKISKCVGPPGLSSYFLKSQASLCPPGLSFSWAITCQPSGTNLSSIILLNKFNIRKSRQLKFKKLLKIFSIFTINIFLKQDNNLICSLT